MRRKNFLGCEQPATSEGIHLELTVCQLPDTDKTEKRKDLSFKSTNSWIAASR